MKRFYFYTGLSAILLSTSLIHACTPIGAAVGAGAAVGVSAAQEGGISRATSDAIIQAKINELWFSHDLEMFRKLDLTINNGRVLITGVVQNPEQRVDAVRLAWQPTGVEQVINEIRVANSEGISGFVRDNWISTRLRTAITLDRDVNSLNYNIDTVQGIVYLMGYAQNQKELNRVMETARTIPNVKQVISYVKTVEAVEDVNWNENQGYLPVDEGLDQSVHTPAGADNAQYRYDSASGGRDSSVYSSPVQIAPVVDSPPEDGGY